jgi:hypothetical protein
MMYELFGLAAATAGRARTALAGDRGQGTVEYVGLILLMAVVLAALVAAAGSFTGDDAIPQEIVEKIKDAIGTTAGEKK